MRFSIWFGLICIFFVPFVSADNGTRNTDGRAPTTYVSESIHKTTHTSVVTSSNSVNISSFSNVLLKHVTINTAGSADAVLELWNTKFTTRDIDSNLYLVAVVSGAVPSTLTYDAYLSSGLCIYNYGTRPFDATISYLDKR